MPTCRALQYHRELPELVKEMWGGGDAEPKSEKRKAPEAKQKRLELMALMPQLGRNVERVPRGSLSEMVRQKTARDEARKARAEELKG